MKHKTILLVILSMLLSIPSFAYWSPESTAPAKAAKKFYSWYMHELNKGIYPLEKKREELKKYVSERLLAAIDQMPTGPDGLDGDYFVDAQEWDPAWEKNILISLVEIEGKKALVDFTLTGSINPDHKISIRMVEQKGLWKLDQIKRGSP